MVTENLGLPVLDGGDYISVDPFNQAFATLDKLGVDYIIESGKIGEWWYRKWKSGRGECGIETKTFARCNMSTWYVDLFATPVLQIGNYPMQFKKPPSCLIEFMGDKAWTDRKAFLVKTGTGTATAGPGIRMVDPYNKPCELVVAVWANGEYK